MPSIPPSTPRPTPTPAAAAMNACRNISRTSAGRSGATPRHQARYARPSAPPGFATPVVCTGGVHNFEIAEGMAGAKGYATSSARRGSRSPIPTGS